MQGRAKAIKDPAGVVMGYLGSTQDISKLKEAERFNAFYKIALDKAAIVAMTDPKGKIDYVNEMFTTISGYSRQELIGKDHRILNSGRMDKQFFADMWKAISSGRQWSGKICNRSKSGREYWVDTTIVPFKENDGKVSRYIAIRRDITHEKLQEIEIQEKTISLEALKTRLELALTDSGIGVWEWEVQSNKLFWDDQMFKIYGVTRDQFSNAYDAWANGLHPEDKARSEEKLRLALEGKAEFRTEFRIVRPDGKIAFVDGRGKVIKNSDGIPIKMIGVNWDITRIKENESALTEAKRVANESSRAKSDFLSTMSHEIRTPLNGIIGMTEILLDSDLSNDSREMVSTISQSGKTLLTIINDILDFSKIESGKMDLDVVEFDLGQYLRELLKVFRYSAEKKGISFEVECNEYTHRVFGDEGRIGQIVNNLVSNAIKFTKTGSVRVELDLANRPESTDVSIFVRDTGVGIPEDAKTRVFDAFSQADSTISRRFGGTGLGLSISKRLVQMMGGQISFDSEYGKGTAFKVSLKLKTGRAVAKSQGRSQGQNPSPDQCLSLVGRVLVAEDNTTNQIVIGRMLQKLGCRFHVVSNGNEVLDSLRDSEFDVVLMDCQMPEMDGYTATQNIRKSESLPNRIPIVALTANASSGDQKRCFDVGMNDYLSKPIEMKSLEGVLRKYLATQGEKSGGDLIDKNVLKQFDDLQAEGLPDILVETIESFLSTSPARVSAISKCIGLNDLTGAAREAHALKSSSMTLGATQLGKVCQQIEDVPGALVTSELQAVVERLLDIHRRTCLELSQIRDAQRLKRQKRAA